MILIILMVSLIGIIVGAIIYYKTAWHDDAGFTIAAISVFIFITALIIFCCCWSRLLSGKYIDEKISYLTEVNEEIENDILITVQDYMEYESSTFEKFKNVDSLISLYPELKANEMINRQIDIYSENKNSIKDLELEKIELKAIKYTMYFGG